ncbi:hypothetical protein Glove_40g165 [Diversispora epigaea]|uniref:Attractin/MKLN-like beta-propeller domain-containing protein n=1 Tax=Diversispora epigaea TaxID=1348612 RepID=A0A397JQJ5_9GLOM|nr:hypothetical protein Glove_40g165 [Diversispora epigaea]
MNFLFKFIFYIIFLINSTLCFVPNGLFHNSVIINDRLLIIGGTRSTSSYELFYLDLSKSFDNTNLPWNSLEGDLPVYGTFSSTAIVSLDNSTIFLIEGETRNSKTEIFGFSNKVYTYDYLNSKWTTASITGDSIPARYHMTGVIDDSGIIYMFGGENAESYNDMNTLDTSSMTWKNLSIINNLPPLSGSYSASILPNGIIVYFGGRRDYNTLENMKDIKLFDTKKNEWSYMDATGDDVDSRYRFSSVLTPDGYIIIFGGSKTNGGINVSPRLAILDTNKSPYEWSIPSSSKVNSPPSIYGHTANLYNNYMIITFGQDEDNNVYNSIIYLYDITNNTWVTRFDPAPAPSSSPSSPSSSSSSSTSSPKFLKPLLIGLGTGIGAVVLICIAIFIFRKKVESPVLRIAGSAEMR